MRRKSNSLADFLANLGMDSPLTLVEGTLQDPHDTAVLLKSKELAISDLSLSDAGDQSDDRWHVSPCDSHLRCGNHQEPDPPSRVGESMLVTLALVMWVGDDLFSS